MTDTPRTDALDFGLRNGCKDEAMYGFMTDHARDLERENARLREALKNLTNDCMASDFNEHWDSFKAAENILSNANVQLPAKP